MADQPHLFDLHTPLEPHQGGPPAQRHSPTSVAAADEIAPTAATLRAHVLDAIRAADAEGLTDDEGQRLLSLGGNTYRPRRRELESAGLIKKTDRTRPTASGRAAAVYVAREAVRHA